MKRLFLLFTTLIAFTAVQAQWVNDPVNNTFLANTSADAGEVYLSTVPATGDTYVQWSQFATNGWVPKVQRFNSLGEPQWAAEGIQPAAQYTLASWSQGFAMVATTDNGVVSCFSTDPGHSVAVKINADGTYAWGEEGIVLFGGAGGSRTELLAGDNGGVWAMATDLTNTYLCYIEPNGTTHPTITISDGDGKMCTFGLMVPAPNGNVFVVYEKEQWTGSYFYEKDIRVVGYSKDGTQISDDIQLMTPVTIPGSYVHHVVPDGFGGAYVYIWHAGGTGGSHNTYVFHFDQYGANTISNPNGVSVHSEDPANLYLDAYATLDPVTHDLIIAYEQTDSYSQSESRVYVNRFNNIGDRLWNEGRLVAENLGSTYGNVLVDAYESGEGFCVIYTEGDGYNGIVKAVGMDDKANQVWTTTMSSTSYPRDMCENSTGFREGQNVIAWVNSTGSTGGGPGGLYGQNIGVNGEMGEIVPPTPPAPCDPPTDFYGYYSFDSQCHWYGVELYWTAPETTPLHYNLYRDGYREVIEIDPDQTSYIDELPVGDYVYRLSAVYDDCESDYALTETGDNYLLITVTGLPENTDEEIVTVTKIYTLNGQMIRNANLEDLSRGVYIVQGLTKDGRLINKKTIVNQ